MGMACRHLLLTFTPADPGFHIASGLVKGVARAPEINEQDTGVMFATNVTGLINMTQAILPIFLKRPNGGQGDIINIGSIAGRLIRACFTPV